MELCDIQALNAIFLGKVNLWEKSFLLESEGGTL
jgi:hypothetical protein